MMFLGRDSNEFTEIKKVDHLFTARLSQCWNRDAFGMSFLNNGFGEPLIIKGREFYSPDSNTVIIVNPKEFTVDIVSNSLEFVETDKQTIVCPLFYDKGCKIAVYSNNDWSLDWLVRAS